MSPREPDRESVRDGGLDREIDSESLRTRQRECERRRSRQGDRQ